MNYRRRRYRGFNFSGSTPVSWGSAYSALRQHTFALSTEQRRSLFRAWRRFGAPSAVYAEETFDSWATGRTRMSVETAEKLWELVPPLLDVESQVTLVRLLRVPGQRRTLSLKLKRQEELRPAREAVAAAIKSSQPRWINGTPAARWLTPTLMAHALREEDQARQDLESQAQKVLTEVTRLVLIPGAHPGGRFVLQLPHGGEVRLRVPRRRRWMQMGFLRKSAAAIGVAGIAVGAFFGGVTVDNLNGDGGTVKSSIVLGASSNPEATETPTPTVTRPTRTPTPNPTAAPAVHSVEAGESWHAIAARYGLAVEDLYRANGLNGPTRSLHPGDVILLPSGDAAAGAIAAATPTATATRRVAPTPTPTPTAVRIFIPYPGNGGGPTLCRDGTWSNSSGRGTCSHHGGIWR